MSAVEARPNVVDEIAARRRRDLAAELDGPAPDLGGAPAVRPIVERLAEPGLHVIA